MLVVRRRSQNGSPDAEAFLPPLQPLERRAEDALESGGEINGMESGQMLTRASLGAALLGEMRRGRDRLPDSY